MVEDETVQEHYVLSSRFLQAALGNLDQGLYEPAMANGIHALELAIKSLLYLHIDDTIKTHNVGGLFGKYFRHELGDEICKRVNMILIKYNIPRYPGMDEYDETDIKNDLGFIKDFIENNVNEVVKSKDQNEE